MKDGDKFLADLKAKADKRDKLEFLWYLLAKCVEIKPDWVYWFDYIRFNRN